jgi:hypothetical protein
MLTNGNMINNENQFPSVEEIRVIQNNEFDKEKWYINTVSYLTERIDKNVKMGNSSTSFMKNAIFIANSSSRSNEFEKKYKIEIEDMYNRLITELIDKGYKCEKKKEGSWFSPTYEYVKVSW